MTEELTLSEAAVRLIESMDVDRCFTVTGGMAMHLNWALSRSESVQAVFCHHESCAVSAAEGYSKAHDMRRPGVAMITSGPAVTNALTGLASCYGDSVPVLVLAGQVKKADIGADQFRTRGVQEVDQLGLAKHVTKLARRVYTNNFQDVFNETLQALSTGRLGPVYLEFPLDEQGSLITSPESSPVVLQNPTASIESLPRLTDFTRPVVLLGNGLRRHRAELNKRIAQLKELRIPRLYTTSSFDFESFFDEGNMGFPGTFASIHANQVLERCDLLVTVGARLDLATTGYSPKDFGSQAWRVVVDIDPAEMAKLEGVPRTTRLVSEGLFALDHMIESGLKGSAEWLDTCTKLRAKSIGEETRRLQSDALTIRNVALAVSDFSEGKTIVPASSGLAIETFTRFFRPTKDVSFFNGASLGSMGFGLSHAIGAALSGGPRRGTWAFEGDGGLWMNVQELATLRKNVSRGLVLFVLSNAGYASILRSQRANFDYEFGASESSGLFIPPWDAVSKAVGLPFARLTALDALRELLQGWREDDPTMVVELIVPRSEDRGPVLATRIINGLPTTPPLGELAWP